MSASIELVGEARTVRPEIGAHVLITRKQSRTTLGQGAREALAAGGLPVLTAELGHRIVYQEALAAGLGVGGYAHDSATAQEIRALWDEVRALLGEDHGRKKEARRRAATRAGAGTIGR